MEKIAESLANQVTPFPNIFDSMERRTRKSSINTDEQIFKGMIHLMGPEPVRGIHPKLVRKRVVVDAEDGTVLADDNFGLDGAPTNFNWRKKLEKRRNIQLILWYAAQNGEDEVTPGAQAVWDFGNRDAPEVAWPTWEEHLRGDMRCQYQEGMLM